MVYVSSSARAALLDNAGVYIAVSVPEVSMGAPMKSKGVHDICMCFHHHCVCLATAGDSVSKYGSIDAIHRGLHHPFACASIHLHWQQKESDLRPGTLTVITRCRRHIQGGA